MSVITSYQSLWQFAKSSITAASTAALSYKSYNITPDVPVTLSTLYPHQPLLSLRAYGTCSGFPAVSAPSHVHFTDVTSRFGKMAIFVELLMTGGYDI